MEAAEQASTDGPGSAGRPTRQCQGCQFICGRGPAHRGGAVAGRWSHATYGTAEAGSRVENTGVQGQHEPVVAAAGEQALLLGRSDPQVPGP